MARPFLFGGVNPNASTSKYLVEFKAGKMKMEGNMVHPIDRKGVLYINQSSDDNLIHFCWKDRTTGTLEDDLIIFPDEAEFKRVNSCKTGRVYVLKFKNSTRKNFYWMQEPKEDKDEDLCSKVNEYLNNPPPPGSRRGGAGESSSSRDAGGAAGLLGQLADISDADLQNLLNNMSPQQLVQMLSGVSGAVGVPPNSLAGLLGAPSSGGSPSRQRNSGATTTATSNTSTTSSGQSGTKTSSTVSGSSAAPVPIQLSDLQSIISGLTVPPDALAAGGGAAAPSSGTDIDLSTSVSFESLKPLLSNEDFMSRVKEFLPPTLDSSGAEVPVPPSEVPEHLASTVSSPQFQSALAIFSSAFQSGQLGPLISQFNLGQECVEAANQGNLISFVKALDKRNGGNAPATENNDKKGEGEDDMALD